MLNSDGFSTFAFEGVGLVPVSPAVDHHLMTSRPGKAFVRRSVRRCSMADWDADPLQSPAFAPGWQVASYVVPEPLRSICPNSELLVARSDPVGMTVLFPSELDVADR